jgi:hypothetical protein
VISIKPWLLGAAAIGMVAIGSPWAVGAPASASASPAQVHARQVQPEVHVPLAGCHHAGRGCRTRSGSGSGNWSGYALTSGTYSSISATWTVPSVSSSGATSTDSSTWVGIDGANNTDLIQTGTEQGWDAGTSSAYYDAWWEILPANETVMFAVSPGDTIAASIQKLNSTEWSIYLLDRNSGNVISQTETYSGPQTSAEFIQEAPTFGTTIGPVAHYSPVAFYNARVNGKSPALNSSEEIDMIQGDSQVSTPSAPNQAANGFAVTYGATSPSAPATPLFQLHKDGTIWTSTGAACTHAGCAGWVEDDNNSATVQIAAGAGSVFQRHKDGEIWEWTGTGCGTWCAGWIMLDDNPLTTSIVAGSGSLWQLHSDGTIWRSTGAPCEARSCPGWIELDNNPLAKSIVAGAGTVFQLHKDGTIWRSTGAACSSSGCHGWTELDNNPKTKAITAGTKTVFQLHKDGTIWRSTGAACSSSGCHGWTELGNDPKTVAIVAGGTRLYQLRKDGSIWRSTGAACSTRGCRGWKELDNNPDAKAIVASSSRAYELHKDGTIWRSTGAACVRTTCSGWTELDNNPDAAAIRVSNGS